VERKRSEDFNVPDQGLITRVADLVTPDRAALMVAEVWVFTLVVLTVNVALLIPAATMTVPGRVAADEVLLSTTERPPVGAGEPRVTVPMLDVPPLTEVGLSVREASDAGFSLKLALSETVPA
jgi:hypothetical protein